MRCKQLGVSSKTVEKARVVLKEASEEQKEEMIKEEFEKIVTKLEVTDMENYLAKDPLIKKESI